MADKWEMGMRFLKSVEKKYYNEDVRLLDIALAEAIGIQISSSYNILEFYSLREEMLLGGPKQNKIDLLTEMERLVNEEIRNSERMATLCNNDSRLGYHSEAEGYKYYPEKLRWRINQLQDVLTNDFPVVKQEILDNKELFPAYTGVAPEGLCMNSIARDMDVSKNSYGGIEKNLIEASCWLPFNHGEKKDRIMWASTYDNSNLYILISDETGKDTGNAQIEIEPRRLWPVKRFNYSVGQDNNRFVSKKNGDKVVSIITIPLSEIGIEAELKSPLRLNVQYGNNLWIQKKPLPARLLLGNANPEDLGWILFK